MVMHLTSDPQGLNPLNTVGASANLIHNLLFDHLVALDHSTLALKPVLATAMPEISEDGKTYTFTLRQDIRFADGKPVTAKDVEFSFKAIMNPFVDSAPRRSELHNFSDCRTLSPQKIAFYLKESGPFNLNRLAINFFVLPAHIYDPQGLTQAYTGEQAVLAETAPNSLDTSTLEALRRFAEHFEDEKFQREKGFVLGSGRYVFDGWETGQTIRLVKNAQYWNKGVADPSAQQQMDTLVFRTIPDVQTAYQALKSGEIDFSDAFEPDQYEEMTGPSFEGNFERRSVSYPFYEYIGWNTRIQSNGRRNFFEDRRVRWALSHLVDVNGIIENTMHGTATPITSLVYHERPEHNKTLQPIPYDEAKAKQLLAEAGWKDTDNDGILDREVQGQKIPFQFELSYKRGSELRRRIGLYVQEKFKKVGVGMTLQELDWSVMLQRLKAHQLDAWIGAWVYDSDEQDLYSLFHSSQIANEGYNWTGFAHPRADSVMEAITREWDQEKRFEGHRAIQQILYDEQPYTLLFANSARIAFNKRLRTDHWYGQRPCYDPGQFYVVEAKP